MTGFARIIVKLKRQVSPESYRHFACRVTLEKHNKIMVIKISSQFHVFRTTQLGLFLATTRVTPSFCFLFFFYICIYLFYFCNVTAYTSGLESRVHNVGVCVHGLLFDLRVVGRRHPSAVGQSVQRSVEPGTQEEQEEEEEGQGHRGYRSMSSSATSHRRSTTTTPTPQPQPQNTFSPLAWGPPSQSQTLLLLLLL